MNLPTLTPDAARAARLQSRCHERLARHRQRLERRDQVAIRTERALAAGFAVLYLAAVAVNALSVFVAF